jgi:predicted ATP-grasp superfamily ATP-dependent carboligase/glycine/D-amino acid oxidase-like deaminating enzyme
METARDPRGVFPNHGLTIPPRASSGWDALVLDARLRQALVTARSLGRRGLSVAALAGSGSVPTFSSRFCVRGFVCSSPPATEAYFSEFQALLSRTTVRVVIPSHDGTIELLRRRRARLGERVRLGLAKESALSVAVDKHATLEVAKRLGVLVPRSRLVREESDLADALREIGLPAVIKPTRSWLAGEPTGVRVTSQLVATPAEASSALAELTRLGGVALLQEWLSGRREAVSLLYARGETFARFAQWAKRTRPPLGGESVLRASIPVPSDIGSAAERLVREIDLEGYAEIEFRRDDTGTPYLMEINPRLSASVELAVRSGVDFPYLFYQWASGGPIDRVEGYRPGVWMRYLRGDFMTTITAVQQRGRPGIAPPLTAVLSFGSSFLRPMHYDYLDWLDPLPALTAIAEFARDAVRALGGRRARPRGIAAPPLVRDSRGADSCGRYDVAVVGAGPYGLSAAAHLLARGLRVAVFGKALESWRRRMPEGMLLRSRPWAVNLSDPQGRHSIARFFRETSYPESYPLPRAAFLAYAEWFRSGAVGSIDETYVQSIERQDGGFRLSLEDGRSVQAASVVMATGLCHYAHKPEGFSHLPAGLVSHSSEHNDLACFARKEVIVVGGGQSALECAALLSEAGAAVHVISRRPIAWLGRDRSDERTLVERLMAPAASIGPGWINWTLDHAPYLFYRLSKETKERAMRAYYPATAAEWLRTRILGKVALHDGRTVLRAEARMGRVIVTISGGERLAADHVLLATGYRVDVARLTMIHPSLLTQIDIEDGSPVLTPSFESSVSGLYFVGLASMRSFGPIFRFVSGAAAAARRVARSVGRRRSPRRAVPGLVASITHRMRDDSPESL